jgi:YD repeat-containing protein
VGDYNNSADPDYRKYRTTIFYYDGLGNLTRQRSLAGTHVNGGVERSTYFEYDKGGNLIKQTDAEGGITRFEHNAFGQVTKVTDARGNITTNTYNHAGQLTQIKDAYNKTEKYTYDAFGQVSRSTNKLGGYTDYTYDKLGRVIQERVLANVYNSAGTKVSSYIYNKFEYDAFGQQTKIIEGHGRTEQRTTTFVFDKLGRVTQKKGDQVSVYTNGTDSSAATVTPTENFKYDSRGNLIESIDANGARTLYYYDNLNRVTHQVSPEGTLVRNFYDRRSNLTETRIYDATVDLPITAGGTPPSGSGDFRRTTFDYDRLDRMTDSYVHDVQMAQFNGSSLSITSRTSVLHTQYTYDANGNVLTVKDPNGNVSTTTYDRLNRKTRHVDGAGFKTEWVYDANSNVTQETRFGHGTGDNRVTNYTYDNLNRRLTESRVGVLRHNGNGGHVSQNSQISYLYNALGQVTRKTEATGEYISYTYDNQGRLNYETRSAYTDHLGGSVSPKVQYLYNTAKQVPSATQTLIMSTRQVGG